MRDDSECEDARIALQEVRDECKKSRRYFCAVAMAGVCGCGAVPATKYYQLKAPAEVVPPSPAESLPITLLVGPLKASHFYREDRLVYATDSEEMGTYQTHRWAAASHRNVAGYCVALAAGVGAIQRGKYAHQQLSRGFSAGRQSVRFQGNFRQHARGPREPGTGAA